jgi:hypothetical protein
LHRSQDIFVLNPTGSDLRFDHLVPQTCQSGIFFAAWNNSGCVAGAFRRRRIGFPRRRRWVIRATRGRFGCISHAQQSHPGSKDARGSQTAADQQISRSHVRSPGFESEIETSNADLLNYMPAAESLEFAIGTLQKTRSAID